MDQVREDPDMHPHRFAPAVSALLALAFMAPVAAHAQGDVRVSMMAHRVTTTDRGEERLAPAEQARPGETLEYRARYRNAGDRAVRQLVASLPIPEGLEFVPGTAAPARVLASLDGRTFAPVPLKRRVRLASGEEVEQLVPYREYRALRWTLGDLAARGEETVRARMRVTPVGVASNVEN
jgi:uncharacterized repeat protein (TIGR01451 family)